MSETVQTPKFECVILSELDIKLLVKEFSLLIVLLLWLKATKVATCSTTV
jgi:hypothetical protein